MTPAPHLSLPIEIDPATGHLREVEQDSLDEIAVAVEHAVRTIRGERPEHPNFGLDELALSREPLDLALIAAQVVASEPRASVLLEDDPEMLTGIIGQVAFRLSVGRVDG